MTDKEIIKALECFAIDKDFDCSNCIGCAFETEPICSENASDGIAKASLDLINRQQSEIERLEKIRKEDNKLITSLNKCYETAKSETVKFFAERVKESFLNLEYKANTNRKTVKVEELKEQMEWVLHTVAIEIIDNLVKEIVGESNG